MVFKSIITREQATKNAEKRKAKKDNKGKVWQNLSTNEKWDIIELDLRSRGIID